MRLSLLLAFLLLSSSCGKKSETSSTEPSATNTSLRVDLNSAFLDPDASDIEGEDFTEIRSFMGEPALENTPPVVVETPPQDPAHLAIAKGFADDPSTEEFEGGVVENPNNRSPEIDAWLSALGVPLGLPYCAAFVSHCLTEAGDVKAPRTRSAGSRQFIDNSSLHADLCAQSLALAMDECTAEVPARVVIRGTTHVRPGTLVIWKRKRDPDDWKGHIGMVREWEAQKGLTVEGNTSSGNQGSQADGGGVYLRERELKIGSWFRITDFTPVVLEDEDEVTSEGP